MLTNITKNSLSPATRDDNCITAYYVLTAHVENKTVGERCRLSCTSPKKTKWWTEGRACSCPDGKQSRYYAKRDATVGRARVFYWVHLRVIRGHVSKTS
jgi:hypothetical protein